MKKKLSIVLTCGLAVMVGKTRAQTTQYKFAPNDDPVYDISVRAELPDQVNTTESYLMYRIQSVDSTNGQVTLSYSWQVHHQTTEKDGGNSATTPGVPTFIGDTDPVNQAKGPKIIINPAGQVARSEAQLNESQLSFGLGSAWQYMLLPLPHDNQSNWTTNRDVTLYTETRSETGGGPGPWGHNVNTTRVEHPATENVTYTADPMSNDGMITIKRHYELTTLEKIGDTPATNLHGDGSYVFDTKIGRVTSYEMNLTDEEHQKNVAVNIPLTVKVQLIQGDELAKLKTDSAALAAKHKADFEKMQAQQKQERQYGTSTLPDGAEKTAMVGGTGGGEFMKAGKDGKPVIGFRVKVGSWGGHKILSLADPIYEKTKEVVPDDVTEVVARDGYAVGGAVVYGSEYANGFEIIFMKIKGDSLDVTTSYNSKLYGDSMPTKTKLAGNGVKVLGTFGRKGLNLDGFGLIVQSSTTGK